jgi:hypothetical protein
MDSDDKYAIARPIDLDINIKMLSMAVPCQPVTPLHLQADLLPLWREKKSVIHLRDVEACGHRWMASGSRSSNSSRCSHLAWYAACTKLLLPPSPRRITNELR